MAYACVEEVSLHKTLHSWNNICQVAGYCGISTVYNFNIYSGACTFIILNMWPDFNCSSLYTGDKPTVLN